MSRTAHAGRRHVVERVAADLPVIVAFNQPMPDGSTRRSTGRLVAAILCDGRVHHYRISLGDGVMQLTPPGWIDQASRQTVLDAGLNGPEEWEEAERAARLAFMRRVADAWINTPTHVIVRNMTRTFPGWTPTFTTPTDGGAA